MRRFAYLAPPLVLAALLAQLPVTAWLYAGPPGEFVVAVYNASQLNETAVYSEGNATALLCGSPSGDGWVVLNVDTYYPLVAGYPVWGGLAAPSEPALLEGLPNLTEPWAFYAVNGSVGVLWMVDDQGSAWAVPLSWNGSVWVAAPVEAVNASLGGFLETACSSNASSVYFLGPGPYLVDEYALAADASLWVYACPSPDAPGGAWVRVNVSLPLQRVYAGGDVAPTRCWLHPCTCVLLLVPTRGEFSVT